ncbi:MAG: aminodeoxychorismate synthase, component I [Hydrogenophilales bacterium CG03_land_8_20_14_0_80_62_28]|nr:aminodeoxychorismate synthase component I [Betaproteobacteria bacterium]OIO76878.1 MAG: aminodeoxychorismate synthase, component I [Hydrogenophilaceae bacterium CG1_02_62_390]PIV22262.1 MAG: aminodeoxychorismate synthase, component I [Hydrogenophilales bacterium CG03_land_8_20_14_0_80_62_28]PIW39743.1 MAG: aminodeoxychorismate synthase, component I [Hydrogenophilales bacterium CG15_BIG_FIL_POST_REV_8_21_14_020_62_31]PIW72072.1 MAG: aminodeoxychorismate synthase, component I [Hydrogenophilale
MRVAQLPYRADSADLFEAIAWEPWAVYLDSGRPHALGGRWDILAARPYATLVTRGAVTEIRTRTSVRSESGDPLNILRSQLGAVESHSGTVPFAGGAIGYFAYDLARTLGDLPASSRAGPPEMAVGLYDWAVVIDHETHVAQLVSAERDTQTGCDWDRLVEAFSHPPEATPGRFTTRSAPLSNLTRAGYGAAFESIKRYIAAGDCYQINLTQRYTAQVGGSRWALYRALRQLNPAPFSAYLNHPEVQVLSTSPERFIELRGNRVTTRPIKGTRPRDPDPQCDRALAKALAESDKDRAENLMIVDLLRNDLGKVCQTGSVAVPDLFAVESFAQVHHLVSTVSGRLRPNSDAIDLLRATFPGGSITGAPKRRAMAIIDEMEPDPRGLYCGAIGYIGGNGDMDTNIAIRTLVSEGKTVSFGVGGGIVADSEVDSEYQECLDKAAPLLRVLG